MRIFVSILLIMCSHLTVAAQGRSLLDSLTYRAEMQATGATGDHTPLWLNANHYGLSSLKKANGYLRGTLERPLSVDEGRTWGLGYGLDVAVAAGFTSTLVVQQAYVEGRWLKGVLTIGAKEQPMELKNQELSSGSQTLGINARPVPQVRLALPDYWTIPGTRNWLAVKGHIAYGMTTDDGWQKDFVAPYERYTKNTLYHSKAGYLKIGPGRFTAELGLEMACQFGGKVYTYENGERIEITNESGIKSLWHAFIPGGTGSDEVSSDYKNTEGNHLGSWLMRINYEEKDWALSVYTDHFFEDQSAMFMFGYDGYGEGSEWEKRKDSRYFLYDMKDMLLGVEVQLKKNKWLQNAVLEYVYSKYQSGPVYHDHSEYISTHICGLDHYYNHHLFTGWQHWGQVIGNPLYRSPLYNENGEISVQNNRFVAWHLGLSGQPLAPLHYRVLATYQTGYGTYNKPIFPKQHQGSLLIEVSYQFDKGWGVKGALGLDFGKLLGDNQGIQLTITKKGLL